jgi:peptide deformylase
MAVRDLHLLGSPVLRQESAAVEVFDDELRQFIDDLFETMDAARGAGLAANQVGVAKRVAVVDADGQRFAMVNPVIRLREGKVKGEEGCLSIPDMDAEVTRADRIVLDAFDRDGNPYSLELTGYASRAVQHEIDHLDGILYVDHLSPLKRGLLLARYRKNTRGEGYIKVLKPAAAGG